VYINLGLRGTGRSCSTLQHGCLVIFHSCSDPPLALSLATLPPSLEHPPPPSVDHLAVGGGDPSWIHPVREVFIRVLYTRLLRGGRPLSENPFHSTRLDIVRRDCTSLFLTIMHTYLFVEKREQDASMPLHGEIRYLPCLVRFIRSFSCIVGILRSTCFLAAVLASCKKILFFTLFNLIRTLNRKIWVRKFIQV